jgi:hypothetical protein
MFDGNLIPSEILVTLRDNPRKINWAASMKDAGVKAAKKRKARAAGRKAANTRLKNQEKKEQENKMATRSK